MAKTLKIQLTTPNPLLVQNLVPSFKNFGEDVYRALRTECEISIQEIDSSINQFHLRGIHKREIRTVAAKVRKILEKHSQLVGVEISEISDTHAA